MSDFVIWDPFEGKSRRLLAGENVSFTVLDYGLLINANFAGGAVNGAGAVSRVPYWTGVSTLSYNDNFKFDGTTATLGSLGAISADRTLDVAETRTDLSGTVYGEVIRIEANPASATTCFFIGLRIEAYVKSGNAQTFAGTAIVGGDIEARHKGTNTIVAVNGLLLRVFNDSSGTIQSARGLTVAPPVNTGGTIDNALGVGIWEPTVGSNNTILMLGSHNIVSGNYALYSASLYASFFAASIGIGTSLYPSGGGTPVFVISQASSDPTGMPIDVAGIFAKDALGVCELFGINEAGNVTQLTGTTTGSLQEALERSWFGI